MSFPKFLACWGTLLILFAAETAQAQATLPDFSAAVFSNSANITNPYSPFVPGEVATFNSDHIDPMTGETTEQTVIVEVLHDTRIVAGVNSRVVRDRVFEGGRVIEDTFDWYAQDDAGNVWYMGEDVTDYEYDDAGNLIGTTHPGMWEAGVDGAKPGYRVPASPAVGNHYYQEFYAGVAEDEAQVTGVNQSFVVPYGSFSNNVLRTRDTTALEPDAYANKYYAPGVGAIAERGFSVAGNTLLSKVDRNPQSTLPVFDAANFVPGAAIDNPLFPLRVGKTYNYEGQEFDSDTGETTVLGFQEIHTARTREILGIPTHIIRGFEFHDGLMFEDSEFYYAQDKDGNVWWMGEFSTKFEYDDAGNLIGTFDDSTWYAGVNGAKPGYYMPGNPTVGESFYEIFAPLDGDIDTMEITTLDATASTVLGELTDVANVFEKSDFKRGFYANKLYAPGIGLVRVQEDFDALGNPRVFLELTSITAVPEPASTGLLLTLGTIASAVVRRRRRRQLWSSEDPRCSGSGTPVIRRKELARSRPHGDAVKRGATLIM